MRRPTYLSHTARQLWETNRSEYYLRYLADIRSPREPQNEPMSVGSAFDAFVKSQLHYDVFGHDGGGEFDLITIFEEQVEPQNRSFAYAAGEYTFECYVKSGAYRDLLKMLQNSVVPPRFEFKVEGEVEGIPLMGKPDCWFIYETGVHVVLDFKVKGFCSKNTTSPSKGYALIQDGFSGKPSRNNGEPHLSYKPYLLNGLQVSTRYLEYSKEEYAEQLALYGWLMGEPVGDELVAFMVEEIVAKNMHNAKPQLRIAHHRARVKDSFQIQLLSRYRSMWQAIQSGHIFDKMNREASDEQIEMLDKVAGVLKPGDPFTDLTRGDTYYG